MKSRVKGDFHARFRGKAGVRLPCLTRLPASVKDDTTTNELTSDYETFDFKTTLPTDLHLEDNLL